MREREMEDLIEQLAAALEKLKQGRSTGPVLAHNALDAYREWKKKQ